LRKKMPITFWCMLIGTLAIIGTPFFSGFYSKDLIIDLTSQFSFNLLILPITLLSTILTAAYSLRFIYHVA
jgi:NADH-quinone oxidoreductase subunit L